MKTKLIHILGALMDASPFGRTQPAFNKPARRHRKEPSYSASQAALEAAEAKRNRRAERNRRLANEQG